MKENNEHLGSSFDDFLAEEGILADSEAAAVKRVLVYQIEQMMKEEHCFLKVRFCQYFQTT